VPEKPEERLLQFVNDYISGHFTIQSEKHLIEELIRLASPSLSPNDVFEVLYQLPHQRSYVIAVQGRGQHNIHGAQRGNWYYLRER